MSFFTGKASKTSNTNNGVLTGAYTGQINQGTQANDYLSSLLTGTGDTAAAQGGYNNYLQKAGYSNALTQGIRGITGTAAASGLLQSGATAKGITNYGGQLDQQYFNNYLQNLNGLDQTGLQAGNIVAGVGQKSTGATPGLMGAIGGIGQGVGAFASSPAGAALFSDRRLKKEIRKVDEFSDGLGVYEYRYTFDDRDIHRGVMADEVEKLRPWALGPIVDGFATVNYGAL